MRKAKVNSARVQRIITAALSGQLNEAQALEIYQLGPEMVQLALLATVKRIAEQKDQIEQLQSKQDAISNSIGPSTPSGQRPIYTKPTTSKHRQRRGAKKGHSGNRREKPQHIDKHEKHRLDKCPDCGGPLQRCQRQRKRVIEDIPEDIQQVVTERTIHRDYCPKCKKHVEPIVPDALPKASIGHHLVCFTAWLHYGLGVTIAHIISILGYHLHTRLSAGGLVAMWQRLAVILIIWHEQIALEAKSNTYLHADETGWRVAGKTHWLWCFADDNACYYMIDRSRGSPALQKFFTEEFDGILITDFWAAYNSVCATDRQFCLVHLLRELEKVDQANDSAEWQVFSKKLRRLIRDGIRLRKRSDFTPERYESRIDCIKTRLSKLAHTFYHNPDVKRLAKRLEKYQDSLFTFLEHPEIPFENNFAERQIRPAVILRKNSQCNHSDKGAATQAVLMSVYRTLRLRGHNPTTTIANALKNYMTTGNLPSLPTSTIANG